MQPWRAASVPAAATLPIRPPVPPGERLSSNELYERQVALHVRTGPVWSYEVGEKARLLDRRLTVNASIYYEDWRHVQLEAYPNDWALNINGNYASPSTEPTSTCSPI
jgi:hypothetical protein